MKSWAGAAAAIVVGFLATQAFAQAGNAARGERVFNQQCKTCHSLEDGPSITGPTLHGVFGRKAGTAPGFESSPEMIKSGIVWDETTLAEYSRDPKAKVPGTKMVFNGIKQAGQLADLVAYLKQATK
ncbi:MAG TPA: cytochrome c family protein [Reyranella sp.]|jgi:cytochrome c